MNCLSLYTKSSMSAQHKETCTSMFFCSIISNNKLMESASVSLNRWTDKETGVYAH